MLNGDMKRKINTLRDILVGRIPDPKTQVDQITLAMIYKFMDDMDTEFIDSEWGGQRRFFVKTDKMDYEKYAWSNIMQPQVSGEERSLLYREGIENMSRNPHIPQLFRDIFNNAYIPFRDSETINMFLKEIDDFKYDNSEDLGNAFEMLLSIMGSQGDAGQFRTPRHIIDMIVEITDPSKTETILDPACGTAGFLISSYKHILNKNRDSEGKSALTPDERKALNQNITGYDISPDMVRLSSVNMYLHHFPNPNIHNYDTLTSEARWDDNFDVILANPPFMTPKGGINPHNRFRVKARRSEVLFVDYIAEHLNPNGKAGIIVPEGIVFQTSNAYKELRKMLIEDNYLYAVISLPAGVFNPYSGVKTSILLLDRTIAKQADNILFVKIDNDGFDLGAQRRDIKENDIPRTIDILRNYKKALLSGQPIKAEDFENDYTILASKEEILEKDCVLVGDRFKIIVHKHINTWDMVELGEICEKITDGSHNPPKETKGTGLYMISSRNITTQGITFDNARELSEDDFVCENKRTDIRKGDVLLTIVGTIGRSVVIENNSKFTLQRSVAVIKPKKEVNSHYIHYLFQSSKMQNYFQSNGVGVAQKGIYLKQLNQVPIPLPPLSVQQEIVEEIEGYQKIIDGARQVVENYKPVIKIDPEWEMVELGDETYFKIESGGTPSSKEEEYWGGEINWVTLVDLPSENFVSYVEDTQRKITELGLQKSSAKMLPKNSVLISTRATIGRIGIALNSLSTNQGFKNIIIKENETTNYKYIAFILTKYKDKMISLASGGTFKEISKSSISTIKIPLPEKNIQDTIVQEVEKELDIIESNKQLIEIFEQKIKDRIAEVWGE